MLLNNYTFVLISFNLLVLTEHATLGETVNLKIAMPEYICDKNGSVREVSQNVTSIRILGKDAQALDYNFDVNFKRIGSNNCRNNQRCTLMTWKSIRALHKFLQDYPSEGLGTGLVEINNTMFLPGLQYIVNITIRKGDKVVEEQQLTLDYLEDDDKKLVQKPTASIMLLGAETTYAFAPYIINAEISICSNISEYYFNWTLLDATGGLQKFPVKGSELAIQAGVFQGGQTYTIRSKLVDVTSGNAMAEKKQQLKILSKGLLLSLPVKSVTAGIDQPLKLSATVRDLDNMDGDIKMTWSCMEIATQEKCDYQSDTSELEMSSGFTREGLYNISLEISKGDLFDVASCTVQTIKDAPSVEIGEIESPASPTKAIEVSATVYQLRSFCTLQWTSVQDPDSAYVDLSTVPGDINEIISITLKEDLFLNELEEFSNGTINKEHVLAIPPPSDEWPGLKGDANYIFRLLVNCPPILQEASDDNATEPLAGNYLTTMTDIVIKTNESPVVKSLEVTPAEGEALVTRFTFSTQRATDKDDEGPFLYKFGYKMGPRNVVVWSLSEVTNADLLLPFSDNGVDTFVEVCDVFDSCRHVVGPSVKTSLPQAVDDGYTRAVLKTFEEKMTTEEYYKAFAFALGALQTFKSKEQAGEVAKEFDGNVHDRIDEEIRKWLDYQDDDASWRSAANNLIRNVHEFTSDFGLPESTLQSLIQLRDKLADRYIDKTARYTSRKLLSYSRPKRSDSPEIKDIRSYVELSELIITGSTDPDKIGAEKQKLLNNLDNYLEKLCTALYKKAQTLQLEFKTVILSVEKLSKSAFNNYMIIPSEKNKWQSRARIRLGSELYEANKDNNKMCMGKVALKDYINKNGTIYYGTIVSGAAETIQEPPSNTVVFLPRAQDYNLGFKCILYYNGDWHADCKVIQKLSKFVQCICNHLGYYFLEYEEISDTGSLPAITITTTPTSMVEMINDSHHNGSAEHKADITNSRNYDETISYVVISGSVIGILVLAIILRKILQDEEDEDFADNLEFPKYAQLHDEDTLNDTHI